MGFFILINSYLNSFKLSKFSFHLKCFKGLDNKQPLQEKGMSIKNLVAKHMNDEENMAKMFFEGQHENLTSILEKKKKNKKT